MTEEEFHEELPDELSIKAAPRLCPKCGQIKPLREFNRPLTKAQAAYRGFANNHTVYIESKFCRPCQPGRYKPSKMSPKEIRRAAYNGRVSPQRAQIDLEKREMRAYETKRRAVINRWHKAKAGPWLVIRANVADELQRAVRTASYYKKQGQPEAHAFYQNYADGLRAIRARCTVYAKVAETLDEGITWGDIAARCGVDLSELRVRWMELPLMRSRLTPPLLFRSISPLEQPLEKNDD